MKRKGGDWDGDTPKPNAPLPDRDGDFLPLSRNLGIRNQQKEEGGPKLKIHRCGLL